VHDPGGQAHVWISDPKYKLISAASTSTVDDEGADPPQRAGAPKRIDLDAMHAYRDAIRDRDGRRVVEYAATLYPGETTIYDDGLAAIRAYPTETASLHADLRRVLTRALAVATSARTVDAHAA
jgi:hypothetical protein